jgi:phenolic acid decarboxylase
MKGVIALQPPAEKKAHSSVFTPGKWVWSFPSAVSCYRNKEEPYKIVTVAPCSSAK